MTKEKCRPTEKKAETRSCSIEHTSHVLSRDTLKALEALGAVLRGIHGRMLREGYELVDGAIRKKL